MAILAMPVKRLTTALSSAHVNIMCAAVIQVGLVDTVVMQIFFRSISLTDIKIRTKLLGVVDLFT